jgi:coenzyme F420-dependent glucose-6-phosphate dehydrogenase
MDRLVEGVTLMRKLWSTNSYFDFNGKYFRMKQIYLYTKPKTELKVYFSGVGAKSAFYAGRSGDGLITLSANNSYERCKNMIFPNFERGAREAGKNPDTMEKIVSLSFTLEDKNSFLKSARQSAGIIAKGSWNEPDPRRLESMGETVTEDELLRSTYFCANWTDLIDLISKFREIGTTEVSLYSGPDQETIRMYAKKLLPHFETKNNS